jgi:mRNA interferase RelE/StbE
MYKVLYHPEVAQDIKAIGTSEKKRIQRAIESKLLQSPVLFGKPLQYSLRGLRAMRVGDYRVVFALQKNDIFVVLIAHRSVVYNQADKRL